MQLPKDRAEREIKYWIELDNARRKYIEYKYSYPKKEKRIIIK